MLIRQFQRRWLTTVPKLTTPPTELISVLVNRIDLASGGCGSGSLHTADNKCIEIHCPHTVTGDTILIKDYVQPKKKNRRQRKRGKKDQFVFRAVEEITTPSVHRTPPRCAHFHYCGGCQLQHVSYEHQLSSKEEWIRSEFLKAADEHDVTLKMSPPSIEVRPIIGCDPDETYGYRNKMEFTFSPREFYQELQQDKASDSETTTAPTTPTTPTPTPLQPVLPFVLGLHPRRTTNSTRDRWHNKIVRLDQCHLQTTTCNEIMRWVATAVERFALPIYDQSTHEGFMKNVVLRSSHNNGTEQIFIEFKTGIADDAHTIAMDSLVQELKRQFAARSNSTIVGIVSTVDAQAFRHQSQHAKDRAEEQHERTDSLPPPPSPPPPPVAPPPVTLHHGTPYYHESIDATTLRVSQGAFFQPNPRQSQTLFAECAKMLGLDGTQTLVDLYCGSGSVGIALAANNRVHTLVGIELNTDAVKDATKNAEMNNLSDRSTFHSVDLNSKNSAELDALALPDPDVVVIDPPRAGLHPQIVKRLRKWAHQQKRNQKSMKICYISCNPVTLARDVAMLCSGSDSNLTPTILQPLDMLPHTAHLESICLLETA